MLEKVPHKKSLGKKTCFSWMKFSTIVINSLKERIRKTSFRHYSHFEFWNLFLTTLITLAYNIYKKGYMGTEMHSSKYWMLVISVVKNKFQSMCSVFARWWMFHEVYKNRIPSDIIKEGNYLLRNGYRNMSRTDYDMYSF